MERRVSKRELYNYFKKYSVELTDMDKQVINMLFKRLSEERQARIQGYIDGVYHQREKAGGRSEDVPDPTGSFFFSLSTAW